MHVRRVILAVGLVITLTAALTFLPATAKTKTESPHTEKVQHVPGVDLPPEGGSQIAGIVMQRFFDWTNVRLFIEGIERAQEEARIAAEQEAARQAELARQQAIAAQQRQVRSTPVQSTGGSTGSCGGATNGADQYIGRESGGHPDAANPSGAYGCYQIMPEVWYAPPEKGGCADLGSEVGASPETQAQCASRLPLCAWKPPNYCAG